MEVKNLLFQIRKCHLTPLPRDFSRPEFSQFSSPRKELSPFSSRPGTLKPKLGAGERSIGEAVRGTHRARLPAQLPRPAQGMIRPLLCICVCSFHVVCVCVCVNGRGEDV